MVERRLNILGIEPFCGGYRQAMVGLIARHSRHRWDWRTLPARRMHRRLAAAARWFADDLRKRPPFVSRQEQGEQRFFEGQWFADAIGRPRRPAQHGVDVLFCTEAINLGELTRQTPALRSAVPIMYVHDHGTNAIPPDDPEYRFCPRTDGVETTYLFNAANVARDGRGQIWFASEFHAASYLLFIDDQYLSHSGLFSTDPRPAIERQVRVVCPPVPRLSAQAARLSPETEVDRWLIKPSRRRIVARAPAVDSTKMAAIFDRVEQRGETFELILVGTPGESRSLPGVRHQRIDPCDAERIGQAIRASRTYLAVGREAWFDPLAVQALRAELWLLVPGLERDSCYDELVPRSLQAACLHDNSPARVLSQLQTVWHAGPPEAPEEEKRRILANYDPVEAVRKMDDRLERLVREQPGRIPVVQE